MHPTKASVLFYHLWVVSAAEVILSAPTSISWDDETILLTTARRTEWLLCKHPKKKTEYLQELLHAAREARATTGASSETEPCVVQGLEDGAAEQAPDVAEGDGEGQKGESEE
ncbi:uncharacterized protein PHACADRAFT_212081 [Phanerochaete carnosa HHB-10118-sp]|uniref:Uncharacterized protein n=1 Tax=Phanerochaete carnosa (strain HHB-10118-sp) TaxID=650164 RepID=K5VN66_PHACS|nr:uncharacterized protein PHACADRAFT_212081 [Phanerochaete carnosa HHB-10118-sp]EKM52878.1 hypothetical protein PHACADRAFT_212081 [Phanerochaete carnosa HHB-10118-sp]